MPFLVRYGWLVWKVLVIAPAAGVGLYMAVRFRFRETPSVDGKVVVVAATAATTALVVALVLGAVGRIAIHVAGERPFDGRDSDEISAFHPIAIAAATPWYREDALDVIDASGFTRIDSCRAAYARSEYEALVGGRDCDDALYWRAAADLALGEPCAAADALATPLGYSVRAREPVLDFVASLGCRRWDAAAAAAEALASTDAVDKWRCVAAALRVRSGATLPPGVVSTPVCLPFVMAFGTDEQRARALTVYRKLPEDEKRRQSNKALYFEDAATFGALSRGQGAFDSLPSDVRFHALMSAEFFLDLFDTFEGPAPLAVTARLLARWYPPTSIAAATLHRAMAIGFMIDGDFAAARMAADAYEQDVVDIRASPDPQVRSRAIADDVSLRDVITFREGGVLSGDTKVLLPHFAAAIELRRGSHVQSDVDPDALRRVTAILNGDQHAVGQLIYENGGRHLVSPELGGLLSGALPRIRPVSRAFVRWIETADSVIVHFDVAALAWHAAQVRDALRSLGEEARAGRWADIAHRQWALASDPELAIYYIYLGDDL